MLARREEEAGPDSARPKARTNERARAPAIGNAIFPTTDARPRRGQCAAGARAEGVMEVPISAQVPPPPVLGSDSTPLCLTRWRSSCPSTGSLGRHLALLMPPLAALLYPFLLAAFHANIASVISGQSAEPALQSAAATLFLLLAFAAPIVALLGAMTLGEVAAPSVTPRRARPVALLV